jgi:hypothetical protein
MELEDDMVLPWDLAEASHKVHHTRLFCLFTCTHNRVATNINSDRVYHPLSVRLAINNGKNAMVVDATGRDVIGWCQNPNPSNTR